MSDFRTPVSNIDITPTGQNVLIQTTIYGSEKGLFYDDSTYKTFVVHKVIGYGALTLEVKLNDFISIVNPKDYFLLDLANDDSTANMSAKYQNYKKITPNWKQEVNKINSVSATNIDNPIVKLITEDKYIKRVDYGMLHEANVFFSSNLNFIRKRLVKFLIANGVTPEKLVALEDEIITKDFIEDYTVEFAQPKDK